MEAAVTQQQHPEHDTGHLIGAGLMTLSEAARYLSQPVEDIFRSVMCGRLPVVWVGPRPYVDRTELADIAPHMSEQGLHGRCAGEDSNSPCPCHARNSR